MGTPIVCVIMLSREREGGEKVCLLYGNEEKKNSIHKKMLISYQDLGRIYISCKTMVIRNSVVIRKTPN